MKVEAVEELEGGSEAAEVEGADISPTATRPLNPAVESVLFRPFHDVKGPMR